MGSLSKEEENVKAEIAMVADACEKDWIRKYGSTLDEHGRKINFTVYACNKLINQEAHKIIKNFKEG